MSKNELDYYGSTVTICKSMNSAFYLRLTHFTQSLLKCLLLHITCNMIVIFLLKNSAIILFQDLMTGGGYNATNKEIVVASDLITNHQMLFEVCKSLYLFGKPLHSMVNLYTCIIK